jgi:hypothetical protein
MARLNACLLPTSGVSCAHSSAWQLAGYVYGLITFLAYFEKKHFAFVMLALCDEMISGLLIDPLQS